METEEEQVEKIKAWLKENGVSIVLGIVIGIGGIGGWNYWQRVQESTAAEASSHFSQMMTALENGNELELELHAGILVEDYNDTDYALMARFALARKHVADGDFDQAEEALQQVVGSAAQKPLAYVARLRLAAVQIEQQQFEQALTTLAVGFPEQFSARVEELRGDVLAQQGKVDEAIEAYRRAQSTSPGPANAEFLRHKLDDLGARG